MSEAPATPATAPLLFGRYRVTERLGTTRLAAVYTAVDERLQRRVLLHLLRKDLVGQERAHARFVAEIGQMARRSHQALLEVFDSGESNGRPFVVTEHCSGRSLRSLGLLTVEQALLYMRQVAGAVTACQAYRGPELPLGLYHPPVSSSNVLLVDEGRVKLVDSWLLEPADVQVDLAHYRAPELSEGRPATPASAVYSLGILLHELVTGARPVAGPDARSIAMAHLSATIPPLSKVRPALYLPTAERLLDHATARAPEQRFPSAQAFGDALDTLWRDLGSATQRLGPPPARVSRQQPSPARPAASVEAPAQPVQVGYRQPAAPSVARSAAGRFSQPAAVDQQRLRRQSLARGLFGWLVMMGLLGLVVVASYFAVNAVVRQIAGTPLPSVPGLPELPAEGFFGWVDGLFGRDEIYIVNIAEGLNLRSEPAVASQVLEVVPNGTPVVRLEGPQVADNIPWLRVRAEVGGRQVEGWMSMNYLRPES
jgi:hypothetical protein